MDENLFKQRTKQLALRFIEMVDALVAKVPPSLVRGEISLSNSEQTAPPRISIVGINSGTQLTHDLSPCRRGGDPTTSLTVAKPADLPVEQPTKFE